MDKDDKQVDGSSKTTPEIIKPMDTATKAVIAGSGAMALSFFLPWINVWIGAIAPMKILEAGFQNMTMGVLIFIGSFVLAAAVGFRSFAGKEDTKLTLLAGALPFMIAIWTLIKISSAAPSGLPIRSFGHLTEIASYGILVYFVGAVVTLVAGWMKLEAEANAALKPPAEPTEKVAVTIPDETS